MKGQHILNHGGRTYRVFLYTFEATVQVWVPPSRIGRAHWRHIDWTGPLAARLYALIRGRHA